MEPNIQEFMDFLKEYKIISVAIAFIMGAASTSLVNSLVKDIIMPIIQPLISNKSWEEAVLQIGSINIAYGSFVAELMNFTILATIIFIVTKKLLRIETGSKK